ncbi:MAG: alpha/beta hydrolase family protein [Acidimicrobiales bacterium]
MPPTADEQLEAMYRRFTWRITSNYVPSWEWEQIKKEIEGYASWCRTWSRWAEAHRRRGDEAWAAGSTQTAGEAYLRAALYYHWASFLFVHDSGQFRAALEEMAKCWAMAAPCVEPPMEIIDVSFEGATLPGYLRVPRGGSRPPLVLLLPGADSTKEELYDLGEHIVRRGLAVAAFDGPGHGLVSFDLKLRPDYEVPIAAMLDRLVAREDIDAQRVAVGGISYGGLFACRAAAHDDRVKAVLSMSSWYTPAGRYATMDTLSRTGLRQYMGEDPAAVQDAMTLAGVADRITVPLLQVYGGQDPASPPSHAERVAAEVNGPATTVVFEEGVHVCNNVWYKARPLVADWLAEQLGATPRRGGA